MAPAFSRLWEASTHLFRTTNLQVPIQGPRPELPTTSFNPLQDAISRATGGDSGSFRGGPQIAGIDLVAMLVSDSGLASTEPVWWNTSPMGCFLLGLQPRGGWQVMQRTVQWGQDRLAKAFGVNCTNPILNAYFTCNIRNRIEMWQSSRWKSPMQDQGESSAWTHTEGCHVSRPTKLIDGSRGGQAFICDTLRPKDGNHYGIELQARMQFLSVLLVAAGLMEDHSLENFQKALTEDFALTTHLSSIFRRLQAFLALANAALLLALCSIGYDFWGRRILGGGTPYVVEVTSIASWAVGATGLLMQGGNPRVNLKDTPVPTHIEERRIALMDEARLGVAKSVSDESSTPLNEKKEAQTQVAAAPPSRTPSSPHSIVTLHFGSLHGSVFVRDKGHCDVSSDVLHFLCSKTLELQRPWQWYLSVLWCAFLLIISIVLQIVHTHVACTGSVIIGVIVLLATSVMRGTGISGPEEWQIPIWKRRKNASYGASLQGALASR